MAIFNPANQGSQGVNAMFTNINQAMQKFQQQKQMQRNDEFVSKLKGQGILGLDSEEVINPTTGKINLSSKARSVKEHFNELGGSKNMKELRKVFGPNATSDDVKAYITQQARSRDQKIGEAITRRMEELGTDNIYKVVDKGDKAFKSWYNATDEATRKQLRALGYHPDQEEIAFLPDFLEKAIARDSIGKGTAQALMATGGVGTLYGANVGKEALTKRGQASYREFLKEQEGFKNVAGRRRSIANQQADLSEERAKLKKELKDSNLSKRNINAKQSRINQIDAEKKKLRSEGVKAKRTRAGDLKTESIKAREGFKETRNKGLLSRGKKIGTNLLTGIGSATIGGAIGDSVGGDTGRSIGALGGSIAPELVKRYGPSVLKKIAPQLLRGAGVGLSGTALGVKPGLALLGVGTALDYILND